MDSYFKHLTKKLTLLAERSEDNPWLSAGLDKMEVDMGWLTRLFGQSGKVRFEGVTIEGQKFTGKVKIEIFNMDKEEIEAKLKDMLYVETGQKARELHIVAFV